ncbi:MAG: TetR/AcrR family transcriptional regulator [Chloroflexota bacterium]|nr:TetR/AcrR family transcriptional regulator [Chloroflexota bacterium]
MRESTGLTQRFEVKRERIHQAAQTVFMRYGFEGASMDAIAEEAQVSKPTLYRYYQNKEALFVAVLEQLALHQPSEGDLLAFQGTPMNSLPTLEHALTVWAQTTLENIMQPTYLGLLRLLIAELPRFPTLGTLFFQAVPQQGGSFLMVLLESAQVHGIITCDDREAAIRLFVGSLLTYVLGNGLLAADGIPHVPSPEQVAALARVFLQAIT